MQRSLLSWAKKYHKWPALFISLFLILFSLSGIILNHRGVSSKYNLNRKYLPAAYSLKNWNLASVRSAVTLSDGSCLIFGNTGIWKTDSLFSAFSDFNAGFPEGMDMRKVRVVRQTPRGSLLAGTFFGLYEYSTSGKRWKKIKLPTRNERIQDIVCTDHRVIVLTRSEVVAFDDRTTIDNPSVIFLKAPAAYDNKMTLFRFFWITHSGEIAGTAGKLLLDFLGLLTIFLVVTGLIYFFIPKIAARKQNKSLSLPDFRRKNLRLHNRYGAWFIFLLIAVPFTGMFLRPPFLIPIANAKIAVLPLKSMGKDNPWEDKMRAAVWSPELNRFILSTSDGFYLCDSLFTEEPMECDNQPPVSVMGINVFEYAGNGNYYIGSFDGLFRWNPSGGEIRDLLNPAKHHTTGRSSGRPSNNLVSGMIMENGQPVIFDYDRGAYSAGEKKFPDMPEVISGNSPMPLWNVAQEIHTGRIYQSLLGPFYILIVPLVAMLTILVLITGYIRWRKIYRKVKTEKTL